MRIPLLILTGLLLVRVAFAAGPSSLARTASVPSFTMPDARALPAAEPLDSNFHHPAFYPVSPKTTRNTLLLGMGAFMVGVVVLAAAVKSETENQY